MGGIILPDGVRSVNVLEPEESRQFYGGLADEGMSPAQLRSLRQLRRKVSPRDDRLMAPLLRKMPRIAGGAARTYMVFNGAAPTTAAAVKVTTGTAIKSMLQVQTASTVGLRVVEWGISFDGNAAATPIECELLTTGSVAATVTAYGAGDICKMNGPNDAASTIVTGATASGFTSSAEGTITATRIGDVQLIAPTNTYLKQFPLGREFEVPVSTNLRIRVTAGAAVSAYCYVVWEE